jgi:predicted transcriptional regulator
MFNADVVLHWLQARDGPVRVKEIWMDLWQTHQSYAPSRSGVSAALRTLERKGLVTRERRYDEDGDEMASLWTLKR